MTATISVPPALVSEASSHLGRSAEQVGFFYARYLPDARQFQVLEWRPVGQAALKQRDDFHVELAEQAKVEALQYATTSGLVLGEVHSHGPHTSACLSRADVNELREWVPHVRWRLRGRPYLALVVAGPTLDGLIWIDDQPERLEQLNVDGGVTVSTTGLSMRAWYGDDA